MMFRTSRRKLSGWEKFTEGCGPIFLLLVMLVLAMIACGGVR